MVTKKNIKTIEPKECTGADASGSYDSPSFGKTILKKNIHKIHNTKQQEIDEVTDSSSSGAYDAPFGNGSKNPLKIDGVKSIGQSRAVKDKNFPKWGGPDGVFVKIKEKCKKFPYCNQGDINTLELYEIEGFKSVIEESAKKYGLTINMVENIVLGEIYKQLDIKK